MKKLIKTLALAFVAIATVSVFNSCEREEEFDEPVHPWGYVEDGVDPYYDKVQHLEVGDFTLNGDSVFAEVTIYYTKFGGNKVLKLTESQFVGRNVSHPESNLLKSFRLRNDSIFCVSVKKTNFYDYMSSKDSILSAINKYYSEFKYYHSKVSFYKYGCTITPMEEEQESFVQVVDKPFERWYNFYSNGDEFAFVYYTHWDSENWTTTYYGHIQPKSLVRQDDKYAPLEIVNY